jgi:outer membrane immunogenic protein
MKRQLTFAAIAAVVALGWAGSARAADMPLKAPPPPPPPTWTGTYIGLNGGYGWGTSNHSTAPGGTISATTGDFNLQGGVFGITYGGNWQMGHAVLGFESDLDWTRINGNIATGVCTGGTCFTNTKWLSTERMRAGWDFNGWLFYGTAGAAFARVNAGQDGCGIAMCGERYRTGWTAGVGVETMFWRAWSAKLEYLHYDLGTAINYTPGPAVQVLDRGDIVRAGINYHFDLLNFLHF